MARGIYIESEGNFDNLESLLKTPLDDLELQFLRPYAERGLNALRSLTPIDSGNTASSWYYTIKKDHSAIEIAYHNSNVHHGVPIAIILQYGHGTGTGGWVRGRDYINPALKPIFDEIAEGVWKEVQKH